MNPIPPIRPITPPRCPACQQRGSFVRERPFADGSGDVWTCNNKSCGNHILYFYADIIPIPPIPPIMNSTLIHYRQLIGKTIADILYEPPEGDVDEAYSLRFTDGTRAWIVKDPEGNTGGWLDIEPPKPTTSEPPTPEYLQKGAQFRARWKELFPTATEEELLLLDNCAGLQLLGEDADEVTFFTPGETIGRDKRITIEVTVSKKTGADGGIDFVSNLEHESGSDGCAQGCAACEDERTMREINIKFDWTDAGDEWQETFYRSDDLTEWFRDQIDS